MGESSPDPDPWGMSDLEGYQDSGRDEECKALLSNKGPGHPAQTQQWTPNPKVYPFAPQDHIMSDAKCFMGPCYACGSGKHWLRDCPKQGEYEELCKKRIVVTPVTHHPLHTHIRPVSEPITSYGYDWMSACGRPLAGWNGSSQ